MPTYVENITFYRRKNYGKYSGNVQGRELALREQYKKFIQDVKNI